MKSCVGSGTQYRLYEKIHHKKPMFSPLSQKKMPHSEIRYKLQIQTCNSIDVHFKIFSQKSYFLYHMI